MLRLLILFSFTVFTSSYKIHKGIRIRAARRYSPPELLNVDSYLRRFGYLADKTKDSLDIAETNERTAALERFQVYNNLPITGAIDSATAELFSKPRCGCPDIIPPPVKATGINNIPAQFTLGNKWNKNNIEWRINSISSKISRSDLFVETRRAFDIWRRAANVTFTERSSGDVDILIDFFTRLHTDGEDNAFDGPGNVLAHAFFPPFGEAHFDDDEAWVVNRTGTDYFTVAAHEFGHSLGLGHSEVTAALMAPYYPGFSRNRQLHSDDIDGIQALYGLPSTSVTPPPPTTTRRPNTGGPNICTMPFNAVLRDSNGELLVFIGRNRLLRLKSNGGLVSNTLQRDRFKNSPFRPDAAFIISSPRRYILLKGRRLTRYDSGGNKIGRTTRIGGRRGRAAIAFSSSDISVFGANTVWKINPNTGRIIPRSSKTIRSEYPGIPNGIDAAVLKNSNQILFFRRRMMYTFDTRAKRVIRTEDKGRALMPETCNV